MRVQTLAILTFVALLVPTSAATWRIAGSHEPDTSYDTSTWMFEDPPPAGVARIYFNGMALLKGPIHATPNVGLLETRNEAPVHEIYYAFLGVWSDCNGDGYIGAAEQAVREYSAALLLGSTGCTAITGPANAWPAGAHNYNGWVSEFIPLGRANGQRIYTDPALLVWGDYERPDHVPTLGWCPSTPLPHGTLQSTGGLLNYLGCRLEQRGFDELGSFNTVMGAIGDPFGLSFSDTYNARSGPLGQIETLGPEDQQYSPAYVWDCEAAPTTVGPARISQPDPRLSGADQDDWSIAAFYNATYDGIRPLDDCDHTNDQAGGIYVNEDDFNPVDPRNKTESDWNFNFFTGPPRGGAPLGLVLSPGTAGAPSDGGLGWTFTQHAGWSSENSYIVKLGPALIRANLDGISIAPAYWLTYYAHLGDTTLNRGYARPANTGGVYGSWQCGENDSGIHNGWNCDAPRWYHNPDGTPYVSTAPVARPGQGYELRDVDCYDGSNALGVGIGPPAYGEDPCT